MTKVGIVTLPLHDSNATRGVGIYTQRLLSHLKSQAAGWGFEILEVSNYLEQLDQLDIVHFPYFDLFYHTLPLEKKFKTVVTIHDVIPLEFPQHYPPGLKGGFNHFLQRLALRNVDLVLTDSYASIKSIHSYLSVPHQKLKLIYLASDALYKPITSQSRLAAIRKKYHLPSRFILYVGDVNFNKNIPLLVTACQGLNLPLAIVGKQAGDIEGQDLTHPELAHLKNVNWTSVIRPGFISDHDLAAIYSQASAYCQPSFAEGFGLPVLEAMACGTPVACSQTSSLPEIAGEAALYFDPYNIEDVKQVLHQIVTQPPLAHKLSVAGQQQSRKFSWRQTAHQTLMAFQEIA